MSGTVLCSFSYSYAASKQEYQKSFTELLEAGPATYLNLNAHGRTPAAIDKAVTAIYQANGMQPFWIENGKLSQRGIDIMNVLKDSENHGLDSNSYYLDGIVQYTGSNNSDDLVRLDFLLSLGMMRYVADQREGRIMPREIDPVLFESASDEDIDWAALREAAFGARDMKAFLIAAGTAFLSIPRSCRKND